MSLDKLLLSAAALTYLLLGYAIVVTMSYKYFIHLAVRWGVVWTGDLYPIARRTALGSTVPLLCAAALIGARVFHPTGPYAMAALYVGIAAIPGYVTWQAWRLSRRNTRNPDAPSGVVWSENEDKR